MTKEERALKKFFERLKIEDQKAAAGRVLLSEPFLGDPNFTQSVVILVRHDKEGSVGFTINQPSLTWINEILDDFPQIDAPVYIGGPVSNESLFYIHKIPELSNSIKILEGLYWGGDFPELKQMIAEGKVDPKDILFLVGYSGWESGQLKGELEQHSWIVSDIGSNEVFTSNKNNLWQELLKRESEAFGIISNFPEDPSLN